MPIVVPEDPWRESIERIAEAPNQAAGLLLVQGDNGADVPDPDDMVTVGTIARPHQPQAVKGMLQFVAEGQARIRIQRMDVTHAALHGVGRLSQTGS